MKKTARQIVTIKDVAKASGVAIGTVSRILNGHPTVAPAVRDAVLAVIGRLGYRRNASARSMRSRRTHAIGCVVTDVSLAIAADLVSAAETVLRNAGYAMLIAMTHNMADNEANILSFMEERGVDGLILVATSDEDEDLYERLKSLPFPVVLWERDFGTEIDTVLTEHRKGATQAVAHLLGLGHRDIALIAGGRRTWGGREQVAGYTKRLEAAGQPISAARILYTAEFGADDLTRLLTRTPRPTALVANMQDIATIVEACRALEIAIPKNLSLVSLGDAKMLELITPRVTAARGNSRLLGTSAAQVLLERIGPEGEVLQPRRIMIDMELVLRDSCVKRVDPPV
jgi:LacI family transcriptional regulator